MVSDDGPTPQRGQSRKSERKVVQMSRRRFIATGLVAAGVGAAGRPLFEWLTGSATPARQELPAAEPMLITDVSIVQPRTGETLAGRSVLVREGRIVEIRSDGRAFDLQGVRRVDGNGRYLVPGYNNMHSHALQAERPQLLLASMLAEGVTGFRQMLGSNDLLQERAEHRLPMSTFAPGVLAMPGDLLLPFNASSPGTARDEIARQWDAGADFIKMILVNRETFFAAVKEARSRGLRISGHLPPGVSYAEAAKAGFGPIEHLGTGPTVWIACSRDEDALWRQQDGDLPFPGWVAKIPLVETIAMRKFEKTLINPAAFASADDVSLLREAIEGFDEDKARRLGDQLASAGCWQSPTLVRLRTQYRMDDPAYDKDPWLGRMSTDARADYDEVLERFKALPAQARATYEQVYARCLDVTRIWHEQGVPIVAGTDGQGRSPGQWMRSEFKELSLAGFSALDVLRSATSAPARLLQREATVGTVTPGADANLLLLNADPLADVKHLTDISVVIRAGHVHEAKDIQAEIDRLSEEGEDADSHAALGGFRGSFDPCCGART